MGINELLNRKKIPKSALWNNKTVEIVYIVSTNSYNYVLVRIDKGLFKVDLTELKEIKY